MDGMAEGRTKTNDERRRSSTSKRIIRKSSTRLFMCVNFSDLNSLLII